MKSTLKRGDRGPKVEQLQRMLNDNGFPCGPVDGDFGPLTEGGVKSFQAAAKDPVGVAGLVTQFLLAQWPRIKDDLDREPVPTEWSERVLKVAFEYHAHNIVERPWGSNKGGPAPGVAEKYSVNAIQRHWFPSAGQPWCAMFTAVCCLEAGYPHIKLRDYQWPAVWAWVQWAKNTKRWHQGSVGMKRGDLFCNGTSHIGFVERVDPGSFVTIEGNAGNRCMSQVRTFRGVSGYIRL